MWTARGAYRNEEGQIVPLPERSPMWVDKTGLLKQVERDHPGIKHIGKLVAVHGDWYCWVDGTGTERFLIIEEE